MRRLAVASLRGYQRWVSPLSAPRCRYYPSCSQYAVEAIGARGLLVGSAYAVWRLLRCNPFTAGGVDPAPAPRHAHAGARTSRPA